MPSVLQNWVQDLKYMQQSVLITSLRGPDGIRKDHSIKVLCRWLRRCVLISAFDGKVLSDPYEKGGGSFTGPLIFPMTLEDASKEYLRYIDELPHHFQLHFMHATEILGYKHPEPWIREWWNKFYLSIVNDAHLNPESEERMDRRLGDNESNWKTAEEVMAK